MKIAILISAVALALSSAPLFAQENGNPPSEPPTSAAPAPGAHPHGGHNGKGGHHPHIHHAMKDLNHAVKQLEAAAHDYGGHRAKAMELVHQAQSELNEALEYAKAHPEEK